MAEASVRLGLAKSTIRQRIDAYGWTEEEALTKPKGTVLHPRPKGIPNGARPGAKHGPITKLEADTLQMLSEGFKPREIVRSGEKAYQVYSRLHRIRLKLDAFNTEQACLLAYKQGLIT